MFMTSILKLSNSLYLLNKGFSRVGLPCFYLCGSLGVAVAAGRGPASVSLRTIISAVGAWMASWLTIA